MKKIIKLNSEKIDCGAIAALSFNMVAAANPLLPDSMRTKYAIQAIAVIEKLGKSFPITSDEISSINYDDFIGSLTAAMAAATEIEVLEEEE